MAHHLLHFGDLLYAICLIHRNVELDAGLCVLELDDGHFGRANVCQIAKLLLVSSEFLMNFIVFEFIQTFIRAVANTGDVNVTIGQIEPSGI